MNGTQDPRGTRPPRLVLLSLLPLPLPPLCVPLSLCGAPGPLLSTTTEAGQRFCSPTSGGSWQSQLSPQRAKPREGRNKEKRAAEAQSRLPWEYAGLLD